MRRLSSPIAYVALTVLMAFGAYWLMFSTFAAHDDEGYLNLTLRHFLGGNDLYEQVSTQYGPFYYVTFGSFFELTGAAVSTNSGRLVQIAVWLAAALLCGVAAQRLTGRLTLGLATTALTFALLRALTEEPMHPGALVTLLLALAAAALAFVVPWRPGPGLALLGALGAAVALVKINAGGFLLIAVAFAVAMTLPGWPSRRGPRIALTAVFVAVGPLLMLPDLGEADRQNFAGVVMLGAAAIALAATMSDRPEHPAGAEGWWRWLVGGAATCALLVVAAIVVLGTGPADLVDGVLIRPTGQREVLSIVAGIPDAALLWGVAAVAFAGATASGIVRFAGWPAAVARLLAGLAIWFDLAPASALTIGPPSAWLGVAPLLLWIAAVPVAGERTATVWRFARVALPAIALMQVLHAYPVAGSQKWFGTVLFPLVGALCVHDGVRELRAWREVHRPAVSVRTATHVALGALAAWCVLIGVVRPAQDAKEKYDGNVALPFAGATRLRLPAEDVKVLRDRVATIKKVDCNLVLSLPTLGSLTMWAGADSPVGMEPNGWHVQFDDDRQREILRRTRGLPRRCGLRNRTLVNFWQQSTGREAGPLVVEFDRWSFFSSAGDYELFVPAPGR